MYGAGTSLQMQHCRQVPAHNVHNVRLKHLRTGETEYTDRGTGTVHRTTTGRQRIRSLPGMANVT
jgi:hypothetical protein